MADAFTPFWALTLPEVGSSRDTWGTKLNGDISDIDTLLQALMPIGSMLDYAGNAAPVGWLLCDGTVYTVAAQPKLFAVIGNRYGGDGVSTFAVPDLRGRSTAGVGTTTGDQGTNLTLTLGQKAGDANIQLQQAQLPVISVTTGAAGTHSHPGSLSETIGGHSHSGGTGIQGDHAHTVALPNSGVGVSSGAFSVMSDVFGGGSYVTNTTGGHWHSFFTDVQGGHQHSLSISSDGSHSHTFGLGGSGAFMRVLQPIVGTTKIICCGPPGIGTRGAEAPATFMASPMRGVH